MNSQFSLSSRFGGPLCVCGAAILMALIGILPVRTMADQSVVTTPASSVTDVSLTDLDLSTSAGMSLARDRLQIVAERVCADRGGGHEPPSSQPGFQACVDSTVATTLRQIASLTQNHVTVRNSVTRHANVALGDLDLSTLEGARVARERLEAMAHRLCNELARRQDLSNQLNYAACVHDSLVTALAQADALAADRNTRTARRSAR
jgi:UrcA family protein